MGVQARADGARQAQARRLHARDRRDDRAHRRAGQGLRERHDPRRLRRRCPRAARSAAARSTRTTRSSSASPARSASGRSSAGASSSSPRRTRCCASGSVGPLEGFRSRMGRPFTASLRLTDDTRSPSISATAVATTRAEAPDFSGAGAARRLPEVRRARVRDAAGLRLREGGRPGEDLRFPLRPRDPAAAGRARADAEAARHGQDRPAAVRVVAHEARLFRVPRAAAGRQDRLRVRGQGRDQGRGARARRRAPRCAFSARTRRTRSPSSSTPDATGPT